MCRFRFIFGGKCEFNWIYFGPDVCVSFFICDLTSDTGSVVNCLLWMLTIRWFCTAIILAFTVWNFALILNLFVCRFFFCCSVRAIRLSWSFFAFDIQKCLNKRDGEKETETKEHSASQNGNNQQMPNAFLLSQQMYGVCVYLKSHS